MAAAENRAERLARNQAIFREINNQIEAHLNERDRKLPHEEFLCECVYEGCVELIAITLDDYQQVRATPRTFAVFPTEAHVVREVERVVAMKTGYWIVEKLGEAAEIVEAEAEQGSSDGSEPSRRTPPES